MEKKTLFALIAVAVLGAGAFLVMRQPEKGQRVGPAPRPIPTLKAADVAHLEVYSEKQDKTVLDKKDSRWRITAPQDWPADQPGVKALLEGLERLGFGDMVTDNVAKQAEMGLADGKAARVTVKGVGGATLADLYVGKAVSGYTMVRVVGKNEVWQATGMYGYMLNRDAKSWRDHMAVEFAQNDAQKLTVESGGSKLSLEKLPPDPDKPAGQAGEPKWKIVESSGETPKTTEQLDVAQVNGAVQNLSSLRANDFADDKKPADVGLDKPWLTVTATAQGKTYQVLVGNTVSDDLFVKTADSPTIYTVKKFAVERLAHKPMDFRDKTIVKAKEVDLTAIDVTTGGQTTALDHVGNKWKPRAKVNMDDNKAKTVVTAFENLQGSGFAEEKDPAKTGLTKPTATVLLHLRDKSTVTIKIGNLVKDDYYVQRVGAPEILLMKKFMVERFLKKQTDLAPGVGSGPRKGPPSVQGM